MAVPRKQNGNDPDFSVDEILVTESTFKAKTSVPSLLDFLKREQATGTLVFDINRGGITRVRFKQSQAVDVYV